MNIYVFVEGKTEMVVYPKWISHILPDFTQVKLPQDAQDNNYYIFGNMGYPGIFMKLEQTITDSEMMKKYDLVVVSIDSDGEDIEKRKEEAYEVCRKNNFPLEKIRVIVQDICFETWCLGNQKIISNNSLWELRNFYDVRTDDPELMASPSDYKGSLADFHEEYLKQVFKEKSIFYKKGSKKLAQYIDVHYLEELRKRLENYGHIMSFEDFSEAFDITRIIV